MKNPSGICPLEFNVLIEPKKVADKTEGGIWKPDMLVDREQVAATEGVVLAVSPMAFVFEEDAPRAEPGDEVLFAKYAGMKVKGRDGNEYLIVKDKDVAAVYR